MYKMFSVWQEVLYALGFNDNFMPLHLLEKLSSLKCAIIHLKSLKIWRISAPWNNRKWTQGKASFVNMILTLKGCVVWTSCVLLTGQL